MTAEEFRRQAGVPVRPRKEGELDGASEKQVMLEIVTTLEGAGYRRPAHWEPGTRGIYMRVGQARADLGGSDKGVPDLILIHCGTGTCTLVEVKARTKSARASKEQNTLAHLGAIAIVNSASGVLALLEG